MNSYWDILGINKDADLRTIKRAYAAKLKTIRQDENPAEFMAVREAYESAQNYEKYHAQEIEDLVFEDETDIEQETTSSPPPSTPTIMDDVEKLIKSPWGGNSTEPWLAIFDDERLDAVDDFFDFEDNLLGYLLGIHGFFNEKNNQIKTKLSPTVVNLIFTHFNWHKARENSQNLDWLATQLQLTPKDSSQAHWLSQSQVNERKTENVLKNLTDSNDGGWDEVIWPSIIIAIIFIIVVIIWAYLPNSSYQLK